MICEILGSIASASQGLLCQVLIDLPKQKNKQTVFSEKKISEQTFYIPTSCLGEVSDGVGSATQSLACSALVANKALHVSRTSLRESSMLHVRRIVDRSSPFFEDVNQYRHLHRIKKYNHSRSVSVCVPLSMSFDLCQEKNSQSMALLHGRDRRTEIKGRGRTIVSDNWAVMETETASFFRNVIRFCLTSC